MTSEVVVSVVIPVLNGERLLPRCLDALAEQEDAPAFEVIVVDNGSTDRTATVAAAHPIGPRVLHESARGPYAARNTGMAGARGQVIALTDCDCAPTSRWLAEAIGALRGGADLVGGAVHQRATRPSPSIWERYDRATYLRQDHHVGH
ncbi:MAG: glycosyltransferase family A protein, partial [Acidimicrobiales bacterium]